MSHHDQRFTLDGSDALEHRLVALCGEAGKSIQRIIPAAQLEGLLLGGGYGRGEGGVLLQGDPCSDEPYNDLEFYVFVRGSVFLAERRFAAELHRAGQELASQAGIDVEFKVISRGKLRRSPPSMFYYDLVSGHRWVLGSDDLLRGCDHHRVSEAIPLSEAARLLLNRCSGLLFSSDKLSAPSLSAADTDFIGRNLAKAQLGLGDVLLTAHRQYHWSCLERLRRFNALRLKGDLSWAGALRLHHAAGVGFKLHPVRTRQTREELAGRLNELAGLARQLWLWLESRRLGIALSSAWDYAITPNNLCPERTGLKNRLINARVFGCQSAFARAGARYPRERLFRALALLLFEPERLSTPEGLAHVQAWLQTHAETRPELIAAYRQLWNRFN